ncbi:AAA domain-containing protein [Maridesulfovibrio ferrireducens]|uniref:AAA domain-containing protein n=1 Tax=Maridesulfovibrio ferrireducens TaxID=246191 RepID=UPI001B8ABF9B|nr:AAA domain-containing protein [Maridesulfovibrio ferrireducens]
MKRHYESADNVKRLGWSVVATDPDSSKNEKKKLSGSADGVWIQLEGLESAEGDDELSLRQFLDASVDTVYEADHGNWKYVASPAKECPYCKGRNGHPKMLYMTEEHAQEVADSTNKQLGVYWCDEGEGWHLTGNADFRVSFRSSNVLSVLDRSLGEERLKLDRMPNLPYLVLRPNTYQLKCQINAIEKLRDAPDKFHRPLLRLFEAQGHARWPFVPEDPFRSWSSDGEEFEREWFVLTDKDRPGNSDQREFVEKALNTSDFAFLEGPPGSGKTTAVCELVLQLIQQGKRVLLCASTHVAVDNVVERLMAEDNPQRDLIIPVRIGDNASISKKVRPWELRSFIRTETNRLTEELGAVSSPSAAQQELFNQLRQGKNTVQQWVLSSANLVCGTTIGILQHPDIKSRKHSPEFDVMIIDEASKTTFQEFLVPALFAKRWILVGDPKQLSPYVDDEATAVNLAPALPAQYKREACVDIFRAKQSDPRFRFCSIVCTDNEEIEKFYLKQGGEKKVHVYCDGSSPELLPYASVVVGNANFLAENIERLPLDISFVRNNKNVSSAIIRRVEAYKTLKKRRFSDAPEWENEIAWRSARIYEQRKEKESEIRDGSMGTAVKLTGQLRDLLPVEDDSCPCEREIQKVSRVAFPSILECLQEGFKREKGQRDSTALSDGIPENDLKKRKTLLSFQHRMHPEIALFPHENIYDRNALRSTADMERKREWDYRPERRRVVWVDVNGGVNRKINSNPQEAKALLKELKEFDEWASMNGHKDGRPWQVAVLSFYRGQEREIQGLLKEWTSLRSRRHFSRGDASTPYLEIEVCTVDRFQGHEADLVLLSFMNDHATSFLQSPNRLNVALTRARYQLVVFGNRQKMKKASGVLGKFAQGQSWEVDL